MGRPNYDLIVAAVNGNKAAMETIIKIYEPEIEKAAGGNAALRHHIVAKLIEEIRQYDLGTPPENKTKD